MLQTGAALTGIAAAWIGWLMLMELAAATACCAFLEPGTAAVTGTVAGLVAGGFAFAGRRQNSSLAGVIAVTNLVGGVTGLVMTGLLEPSRGFFHTGSLALPMAQVAAIVVCVVYCMLGCVPLGLVVGGRHKRLQDSVHLASTTR